MAASVHEDPPTYLDHHATTPVDERVIQAMLPFFGEHFGNAASRQHRFGRTAAQAVERAREQVAKLIGGSGEGVCFVSGATEANNLAIKGCAEAVGGGHIVTTQVEHPAVTDPCHYLSQRGYRLTRVGVDAVGRVSPEAVEAAIEADTFLISVMWVNNEIGTIQPIEAIARLARARGILFHTDAVQGLGLLPLSAERIGVDMVSCSAHKMYGPKGVGALWMRRRPRIRLVAQMHGGGHEKGRRAGTLDVASIVGFGEAARLAHDAMGKRAAAIAALRDQLVRGLSDALPDLVVHGPLEPALRHPGNFNCSFPGVAADALMMGLPEVALSSGSACSSARPGPSPVLSAIGAGSAAGSALRFGVGRSNTGAEIDRAVARIAEEVARLRGG